MYGANNPAPSRPAPAPAGGSTPAGGAFASPVGPNVPHAVQQQAVTQLAVQAAQTAHGISPALPMPMGHNSTVMQQMQADYARLMIAHLLGANAQFPRMFQDQGNGFLGGLPYTQSRLGSDGIGAHGDIHISPMSEKLLSQPGNPKVPLSNWAREALVHEFAHSMQNQAALRTRALAEGGAQAWADKVAPTAIQHWSPYGDTNYTGFVQQMLARQTPDWVAHGQFNPINTFAPSLLPHVDPGRMPVFGNLGRMLASVGPPLSSGFNK